MGSVKKPREDLRFIVKIYNGLVVNINKEELTELKKEVDSVVRRANKFDEGVDNTFYWNDTKGY